MVDDSAGGRKMRDVRLCMNCGVIGELTQAGRCGTCNSEAVDRPEKLPTVLGTFSVAALEEWWKSDVSG